MIELNLLRFVGLIWEFQDINESSSKAIIKYFRIQAFSSVLFLLAAIIIRLTNTNGIFAITIISILVKLAIAPFHLWILSIGTKMNYFLLIWLLIPQKIIPLSIMSNIHFFRNLLLMLRLIFRTIHSLTQTKIKKIIIISSVFSINWLYFRMNVRANIWLMYFLVYSIGSMSVIMVLSKDLFSNIVVGFLNKTIINQKLIVFLLLLLSGIPPSPIFFIKIRIIYLASSVRWFISLALILCSMLMIYIYLNSLLYSSLLSNKSYFVSFTELRNIRVFMRTVLTTFLMIIFLL